MPNFSKINQYVSGYDKYLKHSSASKCIKHMYNEKKGGKVLVKFFKKAVEKSEWQSNDAFRKLLDHAIKKSDKLKDDQKAKFKKAKKVFTDKIEKAKAKEAEAKAQKKEAQKNAAEAEAKARKKEADKKEAERKAADANKKKADPKAAEKVHQTAEQLAKKLQLGAKKKEVAFSIDWSKDNPKLFDPTYVNKLIKKKEKHPHMSNPLIPSHSRDRFITFLSDLMNNKELRLPRLSKENTDQMRQMMLAIMNTVNARSKEPKFNEFYASLINLVDLALNSCSNRVNTEVEAIFIGLLFPKDGNLGRRVRLALQEYRHQIFQKSIHAVISKSWSALAHGAASFNYYNGRMAEQFGLPRSISKHDHNYESFAMKGQEENIKAFFKKEYTPLNILRKIMRIIGDPFDISIDTKLFTNWIETRYSADKRHQVLDETGNYRPECFVQLLTELEVLKAT
jgi:hypothetical protein